MKNLFLTLLLANVLFLGWQLWVAPPEVDPISLIMEGKEPAIEPARAAPDTQRVAESAKECIRLGPIVDGQGADVLRARLAAGGIPSTMTTEEGQVWVGHWVQIESMVSRTEADQAVARLAAGGVPDAYVLQTSAPFSISLGVFRDRSRADAVMATATSLGFKPQVTDRYRAGLQYWLTFVTPAAGTLSVDELIRESGQILRIEPGECPGEPIGAVGPIQ